MFFGFLICVIGWIMVLFFEKENLGGGIGFKRKTKIFNVGNEIS